MVSDQHTQDNIIVLSLDVEEINLLLQALGEKPFKEVYELIGKINDQAYDQMVKEETRTEKPKPQSEN